MTLFIYFLTNQVLNHWWTSSRFVQGTECQKRADHSCSHQMLSEQPRVPGTTRVLGKCQQETGSICMCGEVAVVQLLSGVRLCDPVDCSSAGVLVLQHLPELAQTHVHWVSDAIQPSHLLSSTSPPALNLSQHQGIFQWVISLHQVTKILEFPLQHQPF